MTARDAGPPAGATTARAAVAECEALVGAIEGHPRWPRAVVDRPMIAAGLDACKGALAGVLGGLEYGSLEPAVALERAETIRAGLARLLERL